MESAMNQESSSEEKGTKMAQDLVLKLNLNDEEKETQVYGSIEEEQEASEEEDDGDDDTEEEFSFSLVFDEANTSPISADDAFANGQIKPIFPLFNQDLLLKEGMVMEDLIANDRLPNVKKVFIEADTHPATASTSTSGSGGVTGSYYYEWENKAAAEEVAPDGCKKSNSTGFSKIWRFRDLMHRSSSDGRDAFVFLNNNNTASSGTNLITKNKPETAVNIKGDKKKKTVAETTVNGTGEIKVKPAGEKTKATKAKKLVKSKTTVASAHEVYLRSKAKEQERRRSYLPYRPGVVGFFTNITGGGLTKNVHPY